MITNILSERELMNVTGGGSAACLNDDDCLPGSNCIDGYCGGSGDRDAKPCATPKRPCNGPHGRHTANGVCCLGPYGPSGWWGTYCYAELWGMTSCTN
ncbi:MAG: hypothetical protein LBH32_14780 [Dysgonamonadaceae bacterium]|nr:hypothetical protein [Dysgonamonadaceae bacterium]